MGVVGSGSGVELLRMQCQWEDIFDLRLEWWNSIQSNELR